MTVFTIYYIPHRGNDFDGNVVGQAYLNAMCSANSVGAVQDTHLSIQSTASTFAHELGHVFSLEHDTRECTFMHDYTIIYIIYIFIYT